MKKTLALLGIMILVLSLVGCASDSGNTAGKEIGAKGDSSGGKNEFKVGVLAPLTGSSAEMGSLTKNGIELAINTINEQGGIKSLNGAKIVPVFADTTGKPEVGVSGIERLIVNEKVNAILGPYNSGVAAPTAEVAEKYSVPYMLTNAVSDDILKKGYKYVYRTNQSASGDAIDLIDFLKNIGEKTGKPVKTIALVHENTDWGSSTAQATKKMAEAAGIQVLTTLEYPANTADMTSIVVKLKSLNPEVVIPFSYLNDALLFTRTVSEMKLNSAILAGGGGFNGPAYLQKAGKDAEFIMTLSGWDTDILKSKPEGTTKLNEAYKSKYNSNFSDISANAWMSAMVLFDAVERAGKLDAAAIKDALAATNIKADGKALMLHAYEGINFGEDVRGMKNQNKFAHQIIVQVQNGKNNMIWPFSNAPKDVQPKWPVPAWDSRK